MNSSNTKELIRKVLTDDQAFSKDHLRGDLRAIESAGDQAVPMIQEAVISCASGGFAGTCWWLKAPLLCTVLSSIATPLACEALLAILSTDSRIAEYDGVRAVAAREAGGLRSFAAQLIPWLEAASDLPHFPKLDIYNAIAALGGTPKLSPSVIIEQGRNERPEKAIEHFAAYQQQAQEWDKDKKRYFFYSFALKVEAAFRNSKDQKDRENAIAAALPYMAAAHLADPSAGKSHEVWGGVEWTPENTRRLAEQHPLPSRAPRLGEPVPDSGDSPLAAQQGAPPPTREDAAQDEESWAPVNPQVSSKMPFAALEQIFIFTNGEGKSVLGSKVVTGVLQDATCKPLSVILGKIPVDVIARSDVGSQVMHGSIPDSAWAAMSAIKPVITEQARRGLYRSCVRPFQAETAEAVALFLLYNKEKMGEATGSDTAMKYGNKTREWEGSRAPLELVGAIAGSPSTQARSTKNLATREKNSEQDQAVGTCWFCNKHEPDDRLAVEIPMHLVTDRKVVGIGPGGFRENVQYRTTRVKVPRCSACKVVHEYYAGGRLVEPVLGSFFVVLSVVIPLPLIIEAYKLHRSWFAWLVIALFPTCGVYFGVSSWKAWRKYAPQRLALKAVGKIPEEDSANSHPSVKALLSEKWNLGEKPSY